MRIPRVRALALAAVALVASAAHPRAGQTQSASTSNLLKSTPALTSNEIQGVLRVARAAVANKTLRLSFSPTGVPGPEVLMGSDGRPIFIRATSGFATWDLSSDQPQQQMERHVDVLSITHYTREAPLYCDGSPAPGELVVEYENLGGGWTVSTRHSVEGFEPLGPVFAALTGNVMLADGGHTVIAGRPARGLKTRWNPQELHDEEKLPGGGTSSRSFVPGGPTPADAMQTLWIDEDSLLPLRWSLTMTIPSAATPIDYGMFFVYDSSIDLHAPEGVQAPTCIDPRTPGRPGLPPGRPFGIAPGLR